jgi:hypothetical protein
MEQKTRYMRGDVEIDAFGNEVEAAPAKASTSANTDAGAGTPAPAQKTGDLPHNIVGAGKLKDAGVTTWEQLRTKDKAALLTLGLNDEQADKVLLQAMAQASSE